MSTSDGIQGMSLEKKIYTDPIIVGWTQGWGQTQTWWVDLPMVLRKVFWAQFFFPMLFLDPLKGTMIMLESRVCGLGFMNAYKNIYMYCNIEMNIMKNQFGIPSFGIQGKIFVYICFRFSPLYIFSIL